MMLLLPRLRRTPIAASDHIATTGMNLGLWRGSQCTAARSARVPPRTADPLRFYWFPAFVERQRLWDRASVRASALTLAAPIGWPVWRILRATARRAPTTGNAG